MTDLHRKAPPPPLSVRVFGERPSDEALSTPSGVRCSLARLAYLVADGEVDKKMSAALVYVISQAAMQNRAEAELGLREREIHTQERATRALERRNDLREQHMRLLTAIPAEGSSARPGSLQRSTFTEELQRLVAEEGETGR